MESTLEAIKKWRCSKLGFDWDLNSAVSRDSIAETLDWLINRVEFLEHDLSELRKNCFSYTDVEKGFHRMMDELWKDKIEKENQNGKFAYKI